MILGALNQWRRKMRTQWIGLVGCILFLSHAGSAWPESSAGEWKSVVGGGSSAETAKASIDDL